MDRKYEEIINNGKKDGKSIEQINKELKEAGATFHINSDYTESGWTQAEMEEGFIPSDKEPETLQQMLDTRRREDLAGTVQVQRIVGATYNVTYDEDGYFLKASRIK